MDLATVLIAGAALLVAAAAAVFSAKANKIAQDARDDAREAVTQSAWDELLIALGPFVSLNPYERPVDEVVTAARVRTTLLIDRLDGWDLLGRWLGTEWQLGLSLAREAMEAIPGARPATVEAEIANLSQFHAWAAVLTRNVRHFRRVGYDDQAAQQLLEHAEGQLAGLYQRNGWGQPPSDIPNTRPLNSSD